MREEIGKTSININITVNKLCTSSNTHSKDQKKKEKKKRTGMNYEIETPLSFFFFKEYHLQTHPPWAIVSFIWGRL